MLSITVRAIENLQFFKGFSGFYQFSEEISWFPLVCVKNVQNLCLAIESLLSFLSSDFTVSTNMSKKIPKICIKAIKNLQILFRSFRVLSVFQRRLISLFPMIYVLKMPRTTVKAFENLQIFSRFFRVLFSSQKRFHGSHWSVLKLSRTCVWPLKIRIFPLGFSTWYYLK